MVDTQVVFTYYLLIIEIFELMTQISNCDFGLYYGGRWGGVAGREAF